jgi:hypothetical protein
MFSAWDSANYPRLKKFTAPRRLQYLLEGQFCARALQSNNLYSA